MKAYSYYVLFLLVVFCGCSRPTELTSPDGNIKLVFNLNEAGEMTYGFCRRESIHHPLRYGL